MFGVRWRSPAAVVFITAPKEEVRRRGIKSSGDQAKPGTTLDCYSGRFCLWPVLNKKSMINYSKLLTQ